MSEQLVIGDRIRISVALIEAIRDEPEHWSIAVELVAIVDEDDGTKTLHVRRMPEE